MSNPGNVSTEVLGSEIQGSLIAILSQCTCIASLIMHGKFHNVTLTDHRATQRQTFHSERKQNFGADILFDKEL